MADRYWVGGSGSINSYAVIDYVDATKSVVGYYAVGYNSPTTYWKWIGQTFTGNGLVISRAVFHITKVGSPTGNIYAKIYAHTGTFGSTGVPTGSALATSDAIDTTTITDYTVTFNFSGLNRITLTDDVNYVIVLEYNGGSAAKYFSIPYIQGGHSGNIVFSQDESTWTAVAVRDMALVDIFADDFHWTNVSGGTPDPSYQPVTGDDIYFDANSFTAPGQTVLFPRDGIFYDAIYDDLAIVRNVDCTGTVNNPTINIDNNFFMVSGNFKLASGMTILADPLASGVANYAGVNLEATVDGTYRINTNGVSLPGNVFISSDTGINAIYILDNDLTLSYPVPLDEATQLYISGTIFDANNYNVTAPYIRLGTDISNQTTIYMGSGTWKLPSYDSSFVVENGNIPINVYANECTVLFYTTDEGQGHTESNFSSTPGIHYNEIIFNSVSNSLDDDYAYLYSAGGATPGIITINKLSFLNFGSKDIEISGDSFSNPDQFYIGNLDLKGTSGNLVRIHGNSDVGLPVLLKSGGKMQISYAEIDWMSVGGGASWYACHCTDSGNNDGFNWVCTPSYFSLEGEAMLTGVYTLGRHSTAYPMILDLTYPISERDDGELALDGVEIGSILIDGQDIYVAWKRTHEGTETFGIDKVDPDNKLDKAFTETRILSGNRDQFGNFTKFIISYAELPDNTNITIQYSKDFGTTWVDMTTKTDIQRRLIYCEEEFEATAVSYRAVITATGNDAPAVERYDVVMR